MREVKIYESREEWLKGRKNRIGGSDAAAVLGLNPYMSNSELWEIKTGNKVQEDISEKPHVKYGTVAEHLLRELFKMDYPNLEVGYKENNLFTNSKYPFAHASLDAWLRDEKGRMGVWECKTSEIMSGSMAEKWKDNKIPDGYYVQILHQLMVTGFEFAILKAQLKYRIGDGEMYLRTIHRTIERSEVEEDIKYLAKEETKFWEYVISNKRPPVILPRI